MPCASAAISCGHKTSRRFNSQLFFVQNQSSLVSLTLLNFKLEIPQGINNIKVACSDGDDGINCLKWSLSLL